MKEFDYDIDKYITYRKKERERAKEQEIEHIEIKNIIEDLKLAKNLCSNIGINVNKSNLSDNAKRFVHDIEKGLI